MIDFEKYGIKIRDAVDDLIKETLIEMLANVTRVEVIDDDGRSYSNWHVKDTQLDFQDNCRTLKIFINWRNAKEMDAKKQKK